MKNNHYVHKHTFANLCPHCSQIITQGENHICLFHGKLKAVNDIPHVEHLEFFRVVKNAQGIPIDTEYLIHQYPLKEFSGEIELDKKLTYTLKEEEGNIVAILL